jgi:hypothetical protein
MKKMHLMICLLGSLASLAQNNPVPCSSKEASQFDFWIGDWDLTWSDTLHGSNRISKILGNCTIQENFSDPKTRYLGQSWSVYNANYKLWQQTWVDNQGGYIHLTGGMAGDSMILKTEERNVSKNISPSGKLVNRMLFYDIKPNSFNWSWEASTDGGQTWKSNWKIIYKRKSS